MCWTRFEEIPKGMQMNKNEQYFPDGRTHIGFVVDFHQDSDVNMDDAYIPSRNCNNTNDANIEIRWGPFDPLTIWVLKW